MSARYLLGVFSSESAILSATNAAREQGWDIADTFTPYAVHGLGRAQGLPWTAGERSPRRRPELSHSEIRSFTGPGGRIPPGFCVDG